MILDNNSCTWEKIIENYTISEPEEIVIIENCAIYKLEEIVILLLK